MGMPASVERALDMRDVHSFTELVEGDCDLIVLSYLRMLRG